MGADGGGANRVCACLNRAGQYARPVVWLELLAVGLIDGLLLGLALSRFRSVAAQAM